MKHSQGKIEGVTESERLLSRLCRGSFLRFWSWPNVYRDQGGPKELCDLLVIFGDHIIIFSDKHCQFPDTGDLHRDWKRWYKKAIRKAAKQAWGAERWIRSHPERIYIDDRCEAALPLDFPEISKATFHLVVVAHGAAARCKEHLGGSGSLMFSSFAISDETPFCVGPIDQSKTFVHVFDDGSLEILLQTLDTAPDFISYLEAKGYLS